MMMRQCFLLFLLPFLFFGCREDEFNTITNSGPLNPPGVTVAAGVYGQVVDMEGDPIAGAEVDIDNNITVSDENGLFQVQEALLGTNGLGTAIKVTKDFYFQGSSRIFPVRGSQNFVRIQLIEIGLETTAGFIPNSTGGQVSFDGVEMNFLPNSVLQENGELYSGDVRVIGYWIDPTREDLIEVMPGGLFGIDETEELVGLATFGMIAVELQDDDGEKLQLDPDKPVSLKIPVPDELLASAPAQIPLWSFNEEDIVWEEEGSAELINGAYVGEVRHFSFWNCDAPFPLIQICGQAFDTDGNPLVNQVLKIERLGTSGPFSFAYGYTDDQGFFCGKVPKNELLKISWTSSNCAANDFIEIGPFSEDTDIGTISLLDEENLFTIEGILLGCDGEPLVDGIVMLSLPDQNLISVSDEEGNFTISTLFCGTIPFPFTLQAYDLSGQQQSEVLEIISNDNIIIVDVCDQVIDEYISYTYDGLEVLQPIAYYAIVDSCGVEKISFGGTPITVGPAAYSASMEFQDLGVGSNATGQIKASIQILPSGVPRLVWCDTDEPNCACSSISINIITDSGIPGTPIIGSYEGTVQTNSNPNLPTSGGFKVIRQP